MTVTFSISSYNVLGPFAELLEFLCFVFHEDFIVEHKLCKNSLRFFFFPALLLYLSLRFTWIIFFFFKACQHRVPLNTSFVACFCVIQPEAIAQVTLWVCFSLGHGTRTTTLISHDKEEDCYAPPHFNDGMGKIGFVLSWISTWNVAANSDSNLPLSTEAISYNDPILKPQAAVSRCRPSQGQSS